MSTAIKFIDVSKQYRLGEIGTGTLSHDLHRVWAKLRGKPDPFARVGSLNDREFAAVGNTPPTRLLPRLSAMLAGTTSGTNYVWALKNISFDVRQGEILGIIGKNGAGKSTLLKLLSRVTAPTSGLIKARGRIASLLEVGTGFHPELTGRENVYLNGAILGMRRHEINQQFNDIIDFSGCAKYIDTPVKRYSSGMMVRLGFAVAAHLQCETLVVDEVLAVGDAEFQKRCLSKMQNIASTGRTVLFVSHNMSAIQSLCDRAVSINYGGIDDNGTPHDVINRYLMKQTQLATTPLENRTDRGGTGSVRVTSLAVQSGLSDEAITSISPLKFTVTYTSNREVQNPRVMIGLYDQNGVGIYGFDSQVTGGLPSTAPPIGSFHCISDPSNITAGQCFLNVAFFENGNLADHVTNATQFTVEAGDFFGNGKQINRDWAIALLNHRWSSAKTNLL